jgi:hypothetical protein
MNRKQKQNKSQSALKIGKRLFTSRLWILVACIALSLPPVAYGQFECLTQCAENLAACLQAGQGDPLAASICQDRYDACIASCIGF